jgi:hypothetical protein
MIKQLDVIRLARSSIIGQLKDISSEQLNRIEKGFSNNLIWNLGHMIAVQQGICYKKAGLPTVISDDFWERFKPGSKPEGIVSDHQVLHIKDLLLTTLDQLEADYHKEIFGHYTAWVTRYGVELSSIDDAIQFLSFHEGFHSGIISIIKKAVRLSSYS